MSDSNIPSLMQLYAEVLTKLRGVGRKVSLVELIEWVEGYRKAFASEYFPLGSVEISTYQVLEAFAVTRAEQLVLVMPVVDNGSQKGVAT